MGSLDIPPTISLHQKSLGGRNGPLGSPVHAENALLQESYSGRARGPLDVTLTAVGRRGTYSIAAASSWRLGWAHPASFASRGHPNSAPCSPCCTWLQAGPPWLRFWGRPPRPRAWPPPPAGVLSVTSPFAAALPIESWSSLLSERSLQTSFALADCCITDKGCQKIQMVKQSGRQWCQVHDQGLSGRCRSSVLATRNSGL